MVHGELLNSDYRLLEPGEGHSWTEVRQVGDRHLDRSQVGG